MGGNDHAGVALGATAGVGVIALDDADGVAGLGEVVGSGETDNSATDDEDVLRHGRVGWELEGGGETPRLVFSDWFFG